MSHCIDYQHSNNMEMSEGKVLRIRVITEDLVN
jgi:hypothetical protein